MREARLSRRALLATGGALGLSACLPTVDTAPPRPGPDLRLRRRVASEVMELLAAYAAVAGAHPDVAAQLVPLAAEHRAHVVALSGGLPSSSATPSGSDIRTTGTPPPVPASSAAALAWLTDLERRAARQRRRQSLRAGAELARLLASVGGCEAAHAALLEGGGV